MIPTKLKSHALSLRKTKAYTSDSVSLAQQWHLRLFMDPVTKWQDCLDDCTLNIILFSNCDINDFMLPFRAHINFVKMCEFSQGIKTKTTRTMSPSEFCLLKVSLYKGNTEVPSSILSTAVRMMWMYHRASEMQGADLTPVANMAQSSPVIFILGHSW